ncbi:MAG: glycosyltransferase family 1 protein [Alphaproteobacteria bacterium]|nr:glycosyltransferase family 1 protein [Alphaproteobacteria bacterium]MBV9371411.1 glycosyltransferase family 1 protein [Alphaproteobacteria bacterium]MBV9902348.1 glycosyltransferase family 1 protein [Alphaproteobacteria bacterium]
MNAPALRPRPLPGEAVSAEGLRIALFSGNYNCVRDGANRALNRLVAHLIDRGAAVRVYSPATREPAFAPAGDLVPIRSIGIPGRSEYRLATGLPRAARRDLDSFAPTHVHLSCPDLLGRQAQAAARARGVPTIASLHTRFETYPAYYGLGFLAPAVDRWLKSFYARSDYVLAPNAALAERLRGDGIAPHRIRLWGRGVDPRQFSPALRSEAWRRGQGYAGNDPVILFFGRLVREKGLDMFAAAIAALRQRGCPVRPLIVGDGPERAWLQARLPEARFTGHLEGEALGRAVASADILLNPSVTEAFGNVNLEAMAAGLSVVSADVGSARALIEDDRSGLLVPPLPEAYADAVEALIAAPARRRRIASAAAAAALAYNWSDILDAVIGVYRLAGA